MRALLLTLLACPGALPRAQQSPADEFYLPLENRRIMLYVRECGEGADPVVVLHGGWGAEHSYLLGLLQPHLTRCRFVLYDQRGSLRSPAASEGISVARHIADLEELRRELGLSSMRILAHSMGTFLAMSYLREHPDRVRDLILLGAIPAHFDGQQTLDAFLSGGSNSLMQRPEVQHELDLLQLPTTPSARQQTDAWRLRFAAVNLHHVERWRQMPGGQAFYSSEAGRAAAGSMPTSWDFRELLQAHPHPIHVILGESDFIDLKAARWREIAEQCKGLDLQVVPEAGHCSWIDQPESIARRLAACLGIATDRDAARDGLAPPATAEPGPLAMLRTLLGQWTPRDQTQRVVFELQPGIGPFSMRLREAFPAGHPERAQLDGMVFHDPVTQAVGFIAVAGARSGQGRVFHGEYRALEEGVIERTYEVHYRSLADIPGEELGGATRRFRETFRVDGDLLRATLEWWHEERWQRYGPGRYELCRRH
ncbi:MAG: alpha/beta hydrolase [Planctomycetes bacterium]|nr:alpha/beta hydrolase [Planctomycetota bacterium]